MEKQILYSLPDDLRWALQEPFGLVVNEEKLVELLKKEKYIVSIGDMVTYTILKYNIMFPYSDYRSFPDSNWILTIMFKKKRL